MCGHCRDNQEDKMLDCNKCVQGCSCSNGQVLDDYGSCQEVSKCTCYNKNDSENPIVKAGGVVNIGCSNWSVVDLYLGTLRNHYC